MNYCLLQQEEEINDEGESANDIVYDDRAVDQLLDRSQEGIEEKESWANEYLSSFKVRERGGCTCMVQAGLNESLFCSKDKYSCTDGPVSASPYL